jgi:pimeloyl-ACP methyl ester carboxylesterase
VSSATAVHYAGTAGRFPSPVWLTVRPMGPPVPRLVAAGHRLEYRWIPATHLDAPPLVFLHEGLGSMALWGDFPDRLAATTGSGTLIYSRYGFGRPSHFARRGAGPAVRWRR